MKHEKHVPTAKELKSFGWYRFLKVFFWLILLVTFVGLSDRSGVFDGATATIINAAFLLLIWKIIFYIAYGSFSCTEEVKIIASKKPKTKEEPMIDAKILAIAIPIALIILIVLISLLS